MLNFMIKLHPEITIKSDSVRRRFTRLSEQNIKLLLRAIDPDVVVMNKWDSITVSSKVESAANRAAFIDALQNMPGLVQFLEVENFPLTTIDDIFQQTIQIWREQLQSKTFCVRVRRRGKHDFSSLDVERYVGGGLNQHIASASVKLKKPDVTVAIEIDQDRVAIVKQRHLGMGGFPLPSQGDVLSLMSGGFDSGVATYQMMRKGARTHMLFFNLGGSQHEIGVQQVSYFLWQKYSRTHKVKFISVDFAPVVTEILEKVSNGYMGVILKRMMMRVASKIADKFQIPALVTGESIGQVSSQTLDNLAMIDCAVPNLIVRPLIHMDKQDIINIARAIGTEEFAASMPEYCGVISKSPTVKALPHRIAEEEQKFNFELLEQVAYDATIVDIRDIEQQAQQEVAAVEQVSALPANAVVLDIRSPDEEDESPLELPGITIKRLPFFKLATQFGDLPQDQDYYLYCARGVMSKLQALLLHDMGYKTVKVYRP